jgi:hypothetical protein
MPFNLHMMLAQMEKGLTQVHPAHLRGGSHALQGPQFGGFLPATVILCPVSTTAVAVLPCGVGEGSPARFASDYRWVCGWSKRIIMSRHDCPCYVLVMFKFALATKMLSVARDSGSPRRYPLVVPCLLPVASEQSHQFRIFRSAPDPG